MELLGPVLKFTCRRKGGLNPGPKIRMLRQSAVEDVKKRAENVQMCETHRSLPPGHIFKDVRQGNGSVFKFTSLEKGTEC